MGRVLKRLTAVRWADLSDATGSAGDIPALLSRAAWADGPAACAAVDELSDRVCALGFVVSEATPVTVPFLVELAGHPEAQCRVEVIDLITSIYETSQWADASAAADPRYRSAFEEKVAWEVTAKDAVLAQRQVFEVLARDADRGVAAAASRILSLLSSY
ncbi:hypothetical protein AMK15_20135 [Streptomyces sp. MJM1172]|nr:hypothetical protein AMK15_20135 [Streptomyces sp. MJM1172]